MRQRERSRGLLQIISMITIVVGGGWSLGAVGTIGTIRNLGTLGGAQSQALGINASGQITGSSGTGGTTYAFRYDPIDGVMRSLGTVDGVASYGFSINSLGQVAGYNVN